MRVLVLGATGMLGHKMLQTLNSGFEVAGTVRVMESPAIAAFLKPYKVYDAIDARDEAAHARVMTDFKPDVLINCVGIIKQSTSSADMETSIQMNAAYPHMLARMAEKANGLLISLSTDCVFDGQHGAPYDLDAQPSAHDVYGMTKYLGEAVTPNSLVFRSSIIGPELRGKKSLLEWAISQRGKSVQGFARALYSGFPTLEMAHIIRHVLVARPALRGLWHVASTPISKYDLLQMFNTQFDLKLDIQPNHTFHCDRRLSGRAFAAATGYRAPSWSDLVAQMALDYRNNLPLYQTPAISAAA